MTGRGTGVGMGHLHELYQVWSWLPHFRAIAETEHLGAAGALLRVSAPAMSRALQQLETALGTKLFDRRGRTLVLNDAGAELLGTVRTAMRGIDDGIRRVGSTQQLVHVRVAAPGPYYSAVILPAYARARASWPSLRFELVEPPAELPAALARGDLDICLHEHEVAGDEIVVTAVSEVQKTVACARTHPAARRKALALADLAAFEFVAPPPDGNGVRHDGWPVAAARRIGLTVATMQLGVEAASSGAYLAVLPLPVVTSTSLVPVAVRDLTIPPTTIYASQRRPLHSEGDVATRVVELFRTELGERRSQTLPPRRTTIAKK